MTTTNDQTTTRLTEIRARLDAATPAPWTRFARNASAPDEDDWYLGHDVHGPPRAQRGQIERVADAELIAHAPDDLAHLLTLVDQLQGQLDAIRALPEIEIGLHWNAHSEAEASGRNATLREVRRVLDDGEPPRAGRTQTEVRDDFNRALRSLRVSSSDCGGAPGDH